MGAKGYWLFPFIWKWVSDTFACQVPAMTYLYAVQLYNKIYSRLTMFTDLSQIFFSLHKYSFKIELPVRENTSVGA